MTAAVDKRGRLDEAVFTYKITKAKKVFIAWQGKQVTVLSGKRAEAFMADIMHAEDKAAQLIMAKATGHFKHGNERMNKNPSK